MSTHPDPNRFDVIVTGAGLAGLAMAAALGHHGVRVALIDDKPPLDEHGPAFDGRSTAILGNPWRVLDATGITEHLRDGATPLEVMCVVNAPKGLFGGERAEFAARSTGAAALGYNVTNEDLRRASVLRLRDLDTVTHRTATRLTAFRDEGAAVAVKLDDGTIWHAALLIAADGRRSPAREAAGIRTLSWDYGQSATVGKVRHSQPHGNVSTELHRPGGPLTFVPLPGGYASSFVWVEETDAAARLDALDAPGFTQAIQTASRNVLGSVTLASARNRYPLSACLALRWTQARFALIAEAAHGLHPIGAQGLNLSLRDVAELTERLVAARRRGRDLGDPALLAGYARARWADTVVRLAATDTLNRMTANDLTALRLVRGVGLRALNTVQPLRASLIARGMAAVGGEPALARGERLAA